jgi:hypothetical protein
MGKHETGYVRVERDLYPTPPWVTTALTEIVNVAGKHIWEPACGDGRMSEALIAAGARVCSTDIADHGYARFDELFDFTAPDRYSSSFDGIVTNPPFGPRGSLAEVFIEAGILRMGAGFLALLLPADFDSAKTREPLFGGCLRFAGKIVLTRRVKWFEHPTKPNRQPKENSAWFLWGNTGIDERRLPVIRYAPTQTYGVASHA